MTTVSGSALQRRRLHVQGIVQGVGFRPFVYTQAQRWQLVGFVLNTGSGVMIEVEGPPERLDHFQQALSKETPPLARIDTITVEVIPLCAEQTFSIAQSQESSERTALITPDTATCDDCLHELYDPQDRRFHYAFTNCTNCGPRFTIIQDVPYDRAQTTMRTFTMCPTCQAEYDDPGNRRFHAQPNACPTCGPQPQLVPWFHLPPLDTDPITAAAQHLARGTILALKGLGGYHLACDALNEQAVRRLRQHKHREAKPFALMVPDLATVRLLCEVSAAEAELLQSRQRPIVLLRKRPDSAVASEVAPGYVTLGVMLPYTPLHHILLTAYQAAHDPQQPAVLVMTSANLSEEPIVYRDDDARKRLDTIADGMLTHNRPIHMRCDDSILRVTAGGQQFFRRSRSYVPAPIQLPFSLSQPILACGGHLKNTFCLAKGEQAFMSHHIGDLENLETLTSFREGIEHFQRLFDITPQVIAYDLHPEYLASKHALALKVPTKIGVQHHHGHIASVLVEHNLEGPVIGVATDGTGYGLDGAIWGCEIMIADLLDFERVAHLRYAPLPGGEQAIKQPWRMAAVYLAQVFGPDFLALDLPFVRHLNKGKWLTLSMMIERGLNSPHTSSLGRLFDAVAALLGLRYDTLYEGQAAIELEMLAYDNDPWHCRQGYPFTIGDGSPRLLDVSEMIRAIVHDMLHNVPVAHIASRFHRTIAELITSACVLARVQSGLNTVALSGGVFQNYLLTEQTVTLLQDEGFKVYVNRRVPPNDGGLSLGQLGIAAARTRS
jgi:hydrogenase maturation protein HypF